MAKTIGPWNPDARQSRIRAIHATTGKRGTLPMEKDEYRQMVANIVPGKTSSADCTVQQLDSIIAHLRKLEEVHKDAASAKGNPREWRFVFGLATDRQPHARRIYCLAKRIGPLMDPPRPVATKRYVEGIAAQMIQCTTALEFCAPDLLHKIVQALEVFCRRHGV